MPSFIAKTFFLSFSMLSAIFVNVSATNFPFPQERVYPHGIITSNFLSAEVQEKYDFFLSRYYEEQGDLARIRFEDPPRGSAEETVSEGIAYGMLIMVYMDNAENNTQPKFDRLWNYYRRFMNGNGLMHWRIHGFSHVVATGAASDADVDAASALVLAYYQWGDERYRTDARTLINAIYNHEIENNLLVAGDQWSAVNPSYMSIIAFRLFKRVDANPSRWDAVIDRCYRLLQDSQNASTGLFPDWCDANGNPEGADRGNFFYDAVRTPWRIAWDYVWNGDTRARTLNERLNGWIVRTFGNNPGTIRDGYTLSGNLLQNATNNNATFVGAFTTSLMVNSSHQSRLDTYYGYLAVLTSSRDAYFGNTLKVLYMLLLTGNMPDFSNMNSFGVNDVQLSQQFSLSATSINFNENNLVMSAQFDRKTIWHINITGQTSGSVVELTAGTGRTIDYTNVINRTWTTSDIDAVTFRDGETVEVELRYLNRGVYETVTRTLVIEEIKKYLIGPSVIDDFDDLDLTAYIQSQWQHNSGSGASGVVFEASQNYGRNSLRASFNGSGSDSYLNTYIAFNPDNNAIDASDISAIVYYYRGSSHMLRLISSETEIDGGHFQAEVPASTEWRRQVIRRHSLVKPAGAENYANIPMAFQTARGLEWSVSGSGEQTLYIDAVFVPELNINSVSVEENFAGAGGVNDEKMKIYPNPFNPVTNISFNVKNANENVSISIYNVQGALVKEFDLSVVNTGRHSVVFDGSKYSSGIYFVKFKNGDFIEMRRAVLIK